MIIWREQCNLNETPRQAAERFVNDYFNCHRTIRWTDVPGEFRFSDSAWHYEIDTEGGYWIVSRTNKPTPRLNERRKARRESNTPPASPP